MFDFALHWLKPASAFCWSPRGRTLLCVEVALDVSFTREVGAPGFLLGDAVRTLCQCEEL